MPGNSGNKSNKTKLHGSTNSLRDTFNQALNKATTAEQAKSKQIPSWSESEKNYNLNRLIRDGDAQAFYGIPEEAIRKMYDPATADIIVKTIKDQQKIRDSWLDLSETPAETASKPETQYAEQAVKEQAKSEKSAEEKTLDDVWADSLGIPRSELNSAKPNTASQPAANPEKVTPERQAAKDMVDNSKPAKRNEQPAWVTTPWRETMYRLGDRTPEINPPEKYEPSSNNLWDFPELAVSRNSSRIPNYLKDAYERKVGRDIRKQESRMDLDNINLRTGHVMSPARYNSFSSIYGRNAPLIHGLAAAGVLGLGGLGLYGKYKYGDINQPQTQVPYRMEPEPVNEAVAQPEPTLEQQFVLQSTSPFDYAKGINLFDLYDRYGSPDSIDNSIPEEQSADENMLQPDSDTYKNAQEMGQRIASGMGYAPELKEGNFVSPQNPPEVGSDIKTAGLEFPDGGEVPQELDRLSGVKPRVIKDTSRGPVVLNDSNRRKTNNRVNYQDAARQMLGASEAVNNLAREAYNFNRQQNSQKPETGLLTPEQAAARQMVNQYVGIPVKTVRAKNQPFLTTDAIWNRLRQKGLVSPEEGIRSGLFTPDEVRYITENDLWRYR